MRCRSSTSRPWTALPVLPWMGASTRPAPFLHSAAFASHRNLGSSRPSLSFQDSRLECVATARPLHIMLRCGTYDEAVAVQPGLPAVTIASLSPNKPPRISSDPDLSLCVISGRDERPNVDLDASESDNTLPPLGRLIESINKEQPKSKSSPGKLPYRRRLDIANKAIEAVETLPAGDGTRADKGYGLLASSTKQTYDGDDVANANCLTSSTTGLYHVSPTSPTTPPLSHTPHESPHDYDCTSYPVDPALMACHRGKTDTPTEVPRHAARVRASALWRRLAVGYIVVRSMSQPATSH